MAFLADHGLDWATRAPLLLRPNSDPTAGPPRLAHLTAADYVRCGHLPAEDFARFYSFSIVRNPWVRAVSLYRHLAPNLSFAAFASEWLAEALRPGSGLRWFVRPQCDFVLCGGKVAVDDLLHVETLSRDFGRVARRAGLVSPLVHANRSDARTAPDVARRVSTVRRVTRAIRAAVTPSRFEAHAGWRDFYSATAAEAIRRHYAGDCETFRYVFDQEAPLS